MDRLKIRDALALAHSYLYDALQYDVPESRGNRIRLAMQEIGDIMDELSGHKVPRIMPTETSRHGLRAAISPNGSQGKGSKDG